MNNARMAGGRLFGARNEQNTGSYVARTLAACLSLNDVRSACLYYLGMTTVAPNRFVSYVRTRTLAPRAARRCAWLACCRCGLFIHRQPTFLLTARAVNVYGFALSAAARVNRAKLRQCMTITMAAFHLARFTPFVLCGSNMASIHTHGFELCLFAPAFARTCYFCVRADSITILGSQCAMYCSYVHTTMNGGLFPGVYVFRRTTTHVVFLSHRCLVTAYRCSGRTR